MFRKNSYNLFKLFILIPAFILYIGTERYISASILHQAVKNNNYKKVKRLLKDFSILIQDKYGNYPIHYARTKNMVKLILSACKTEACKEKCEKNESKCKECIKKLCVELKNKQKETPLHLASKRGDVEVIKELLKFGASVNARDIYQNTPLHFASRYGNDKAILTLLEFGGEIDAKNRYNLTPLLLAIIGKHPNSVAILLSNGSDVLIGGGKLMQCYPIHIASFISYDLLRLILAKTKKINIRCNFKKKKTYTPLHFAVLGRHLRAIDKLIKNGGDPNIQSEIDGYTPLHIAIEKKYYRIANYLINQGASLSIQDNFGKNAIFMAILYKANTPSYRELIDNIISKCKDNPKPFFSYDKLKRNIFHYIGLYADYQTAKRIFSKILLYPDAISLINSKDTFGFYPIHYAVWKNSKNIVSLFSTYKGYLEKIGAKGKTILHLAVENQKERNIILPFIVREIIEKNKEKLLYQKDNEGNNFFHILLYKKHFALSKKIFKEILSYKRYNTLYKVLTTRNNKGISPIDILKDELIHIKDISKEWEIIPLKELIYNYYCDDKKVNDNIFAMAKGGCLLNIANKISKDKETLKASDKEGNNILHIASLFNHLNTVRYILNIVKANGIKELIIKANKSGYTPLHYAVISKNKKIIKEIVDSCYIIAVSENIDCKKMLINFQNNNGDTPLHLAVRHPSEEIIKFLISYGANRNIKNKSGLLPFDIAKKLQERCKTIVCRRIYQKIINILK
jgi:ankyrin repeat protein